MTNLAAAVELKACPFCGGPVKLEKADIGRSSKEWFGVVCRNTKNVGGSCCMEQVASRTKEAAIARWNTRPPALGELSDTVLFNLYAEMNAVYVLSGKIPSAAQVAKAAREFLGKVDG